MLSGINTYTGVRGAGLCRESLELRVGNRGPNQLHRNSKLAKRPPYWGRWVELCSFPSSLSCPQKGGWNVHEVPSSGLEFTGKGFIRGPCSREEWVPNSWKGNLVDGAQHVLDIDWWPHTALFMKHSSHSSPCASVSHPFDWFIL